MDRAGGLAIPETSSTYEYKPAVITGWPDSAAAPILCAAQRSDRGSGAGGASAARCGPRRDL
jgi:hypothetical protein